MKTFNSIKAITRKFPHIGRPKKARIRKATMFKKFGLASGGVMKRTTNNFIGNMASRGRGIGQ